MMSVGGKGAELDEYEVFDYIFSEFEGFADCFLVSPPYLLSHISNYPNTMLC
jgi:hypothetical protein